MAFRYNQLIFNQNSYRFHLIMKQLFYFIQKELNLYLQYRVYLFQQCSIYGVLSIHNFFKVWVFNEFFKRSF